MDKGDEGVVVEGEDDDDDFFAIDVAHYVPGNLNAEHAKIFYRIIRLIANKFGKVIGDDVIQIIGNDEAAAIDETVRARPDDNVFYVDGPGGTGKSFLFNTIINFVRNTFGLSTLAVAWTGLAANLLIGGTTVHRMFKLPLNLNERSAVGWSRQADKTRVIAQAAVILWDEAPMTHRHAVEAVDRYLREVCEWEGRRMGNKCVVFGGDFRQVLHVIPRGHRTAIVDATLKRLSWWDEVVLCRLTTNVRVANRGGCAEVR